MIDARERYQAIIQQATEGIILVDFKTRQVLEVNPAYGKLLGYTEAEFKNLTLYDVVAHDRESIDRYCHRIYDEGQVFIGERRHRRKDGMLVEVEVSASLIKYAGKETMCVIVRDITERKQAEAEIRRMALMLDTAPNSITVHDFDGRFLYANQKTFDLHGFNRDEFLALNLHQLDVSDSENLIAPRMQELLDRGKATFQVAHYRKDGSILPLEINAMVTTWGDKKVILSIATDITERKKAEDALRQQKETEQRFREQLEALHQVRNELDTVETIDDLCRRAIELGRSKLGFGRLGLWFATETPNVVAGAFGVDETGNLRDERAQRLTITPNSTMGRVLHQKHFVYQAEDTALVNDAGQVVGKGTHVVAGLWDGEGILGYLSTDNLLESKPITEQQSELLALYASTIASLYTRNQAETELKNSQQELRALAVHLNSIREEEKMHISREIHDELGQSLTALKMDVFWLGKKMPKEQKPLIEKTKDMAQLLDQTIKTVKRISTDLRPGMLDDLGLPATLEWQADEFHRHTGVPCRITVRPATIKVTQEQATGLFRILQETLPIYQDMQKRPESQ